MVGLQFLLLTVTEKQRQAIDQGKVIGVLFLHFPKKDCWHFP